MATFRVVDPALVRSDFSRALRMIADTFGHEWLDSPPKSAVDHAVVGAYARAKQVLEEISRGKQAEIPIDVLRLKVFADNLAMTKPLPAFEQVILRSNLRGNEFGRYEYMIYVASECLRSGHRVSFIPEVDGHSSPDIYLQVPEPVYVECKSKDRLTSRLDGKLEGWEGELSRALAGNPSDLNRSEEVLVILDEDVDDSALADLIAAGQALLAAPRYGVAINPHVGCYVAVLPAPMSPNHPPGGVWAPADKIPIEISGLVRISADRPPELVAQRIVTVHRFNSNRLRSVFHSLSTAAKQLPANSAGVVFIDVDTAHTRDSAIVPYLQTVTAALEAGFRPNQATRIGAVCLTGTPVVSPTVVDGRPGFIQHRPRFCARNPFGSLPAGFRLHTMSWNS